MKIFILLSLLFFSTLFANNEEEVNYSDDVMPQVLYISYMQTPQRVLKGEIFSVTLKTLSTVSNFEDIRYTFSNYYGLKALNSVPQRVKKNNYYIETFYFLATKNKAKLPDIVATLIANQTYQSTRLQGTELNVIALNPKKDFSNIIADAFEIVEYKTTSFDHLHNIIVFTAKAKNCDISALKFEKVYKQGSESIDTSYENSKITYFAIIDKEMENFSFSYFNLRNNNFSTITLPIIVDDDSVTTQTDIKPKDQSKEELKMYIAAAVLIIGLLIIFWMKKYILLILLLIPIAYIASVILPSKEVCIKKGSAIYILPVRNGTVFETVLSESQLPKEGTAQNFVKVKLENDRIGWIKNEDICSH